MGSRTGAILVEVRLLIRRERLQDGCNSPDAGGCRRPEALTCMMRMWRMLRMYLFALASRVIDLARTAKRSRCFASLLRGRKWVL